MGLKYRENFMEYTHVHSRESLTNIIKLHFCREFFEAVIYLPSYQNKAFDIKINII